MDICIHVNEILPGNEYAGGELQWSVVVLTRSPASSWYCYSRNAADLVQQLVGSLTTSFFGSEVRWALACP